MNLKSLFGKLNTTCREATEGAAGLCLAKTSYDVEVEHLLARLLETDNTDLERICRHFDVDMARLAGQLMQAIDGFKTGNTRTPALSPHLTHLIEQAWVVASVEFEQPAIRSGHLALAMLEDAQLHRLLRESAAELDKLDAATLHASLAALTAGSVEDAPAAASAGADLPPGRTGGKTPALDQFTINLTQRAAQGHIDPVLGRDAEIRQMIDILTRRRQNNPILTGEAGVGKTAVVEGLALRIAQGDVPEPLKPVALHTLDLGLLQAGAGVKGEFENRLKSVIQEVKSSVRPIILFIDEAHTMIGAGGQAGQNDAANLLKPALARGELRTIAATTWAEYKKYFEKDAALARRFQVVKVDEPREDKAIAMLRGMQATMENHHGVRILDDAIVQTVRLSQRYITGRQLPDKAVSVLDTACARVTLGQSTVPGALEDLRRRIDDLRTETAALEREHANGHDHTVRLDELREALSTAQTEANALEQRWQAERDQVRQILDVQRRLDALHASAKATDAEQTTPNGATLPDSAALLTELSALREQLATLQGEAPLVPYCVDGNAVSAVISAWTGIPVGKMLKDEIDTVLNLQSLMGERVLGQSHALEEIAKRLQVSRAGIEDPNKPIGVFLLLGPSGVGKTETALALADIFYGGERNLITINMSEYQEAHTVSSLKGSPPGYVGYGEGGVLTEAVRRKPYSVVLLDEVEKAHPDVLELFFQVFDKGVMDDGEGREINFRNTVILLTSNVGTEHIMATCQDNAQRPAPQVLANDLKPLLNRVFKPAFLGRLSVVPYYPVQDEILEQIVELKLRKIVRRMQASHRATLTYDNALVKAIAARCTEVDSGARNIDNILSSTIMPALSQAILERMASGEPVDTVSICVADDGAFEYRVGSPV